MAGGGDTVELVVAVSNSGGLGIIGAVYLSPEQIVELARRQSAAELMARVKSETAQAVASLQNVH